MSGGGSWFRMTAESMALLIRERAHVAAVERRHATRRPWACEDCGWPWPLPGYPPDGAECDNCGGELIVTVR